MVEKQQSSQGPSTHWDQLLPILYRSFVWLMLFSVLYLLRSFFVLILLTFVFAYIQARGEQRLRHVIPRRGLRVTIVGLLLFAALILIGWFIVPPIREQAELFADRIPMHLRALDVQLEKLEKAYPILAEALSDHSKPHRIVDHNTGVEREVNSSRAVDLAQSLLGWGEGSGGNETIISILVEVRKIGSTILALGSAFLLSLLFSFLIVLDLEKLSAGARGLRNTRVRFIYEEVAESIYNFGQTMGRSLEAQLMIAILNTILTAIGMFILGIGEKAAFLSLIVFICSFIPVAGVWISSVPICLVALQQGGFTLVLLSILLITIIHLIEAYILNPKIYGQHLHMNPVIVLIILTIGGKLFGFWGLVLGVPVCTYIFWKAIRLNVDTASSH